MYEAFYCSHLPLILLSSVGAPGVRTSLHGHPPCCCGESSSLFDTALCAVTHSSFRIAPFALHPFLIFSVSAIGHVVVPLHPIQRWPDPHQHHPALHAFHVQDAQHEHEAWVSLSHTILSLLMHIRLDTTTVKVYGKQWVCTCLTCDNVLLLSE